MGDTYAVSSIIDLEDASRTDLKNDYFIISKSDGNNTYKSYKTTFSQISSALCAEIGKSIAETKIDVTLDKLPVVSTIDELTGIGDPQNYLGNGRILLELNSKADSKASLTGTSTINAENQWKFTKYCPQSTIDPSDPDDLVRLGYLSTAIDEGKFCDAENFDELCSTIVTSDASPIDGCIIQSDTCPVIIETDEKNSLVRIDIAVNGSTTNSVGTFLFIRDNEHKTAQDVRKWTNTLTSNVLLRQLSSNLILLDSDKTSNGAYNAILPIKANQIICIFPNTVRTSVSYDYVKWTYTTLSSTYNKYASDYPELSANPPSDEYKDVTYPILQSWDKLKRLTSTAWQKPYNAKFIVYYDNNQSKPWRYYYTKSVTSTIAKIFPARAKFSSKTTIEVTRFL